MSEKRRIKRGLWSIVIITVLLIAIGSGGWYFAASKLEEQLAVVKSDQSSRGREISCSNQEVRGYPFRIGVFCDDVSVQDNGGAFHIKTGAIRSAAQVYNPSKLITEIESPLQLTTAEGTLDATWDLARSSLAIGLDGPKRYSGTLTNLQLGLPERNISLAADNVEVHARTVGDDNLDFASTLLNLDLGELRGRKTPALDLNIDTQLEAVVRQLKRGRSLEQIARKGDLKGIMRTLAFTLNDGGKLSLSGPFAVDKKGRLSGDIKVGVEDLPKIIRALKSTFPNIEQQLDQANMALSALAGSNAGKAGSFDVIVRKGQIKLGFFPIGKLPRLF